MGCNYAAIWKLEKNGHFLNKKKFAEYTYHSYIFHNPPKSIIRVGSLKSDSNKFIGNTLLYYFAPKLWKLSIALPIISHPSFINFARVSKQMCFLKSILNCFFNQYVFVIFNQYVFIIFNQYVFYYQNAVIKCVASLWQNALSSF